MRVLGRLRLSRSTEESTSIERQREIIEQWADSNDHTIVGWAEDVDVSGSVDPFDAPQLGEWLDTRAPEWDVLAVWKLDRLTRSTINLNKVFGWCLDHDKTVISVTESIDLSTPVGRLIANVIGFLAEGELEAIRERVRGSKRKLRELGRWGGGKPPYGYRAVKGDSGWHLEVDPLASTVVRRIVEEVVDGKPITRIANDLTDERYLTPGDYHRTVKAGEPRLRGTKHDEGLTKWNPTPIRNMLRSKALRGFAHHRGHTVRDDRGMPIQLAESLVTLDEWELIQAALDRVQESRKNVRRSEASPLTGVAVCIECDQPLHHDRYNISRPKYGKEYAYRYYRCRERHTTMVPAGDLEQLCEEGFLAQIGDCQMQQRVWVAGDDSEEALREAVTAFEELSKAAGRAKSALAKQRLQAQLDALDEKIAGLESEPARGAGWEYRPAGGTYREMWESADVDQRRALLLDAGIQIAAGIRGVEGKRSASNPGVLRVDFRVPEQLREKLGLRPIIG